jgi:hypothetical protein
MVTALPALEKGRKRRKGKKEKLRERPGKKPGGQKAKGGERSLQHKRWEQANKSKPKSTPAAKALRAEKHKLPTPTNRSTDGLKVKQQAPSQGKGCHNTGLH